MTDPIREIFNLFSITDYITPIENTIQDITHAKEDSRTFFFSERNLAYVQDLFRDNDISFWSAEKSGFLGGCKAHITIKAKDQNKARNLLSREGIKIDS